MTYQGNAIDEISDELWTTLSVSYWSVRQEIERKKLPPLEKNYIRLLRERFHIEVTEEEFLELKDYAENYYSDSVVNRIYEDIANGMQEVRR